MDQALKVGHCSFFIFSIFNSDRKKFHTRKLRFLIRTYYPIISTNKKSVTQLLIKPLLLKVFPLVAMNNTTENSCTNSHHSEFAKQRCTSPMVSWFIFLFSPSPFSFKKPTLKSEKQFSAQFHMPLIFLAFVFLETASRVFVQKNPLKLAKCSKGKFAAPLVKKQAKLFCEAHRLYEWLLFFYATLRW